MIAAELPHPPAGAKTLTGGWATAKKLYFITNLWYTLNTQTHYHVIGGEVART
jgi:hypothetical protein